MIEVFDKNQFLLENKTDDVFIHIVENQQNVHPCDNTPVLILIKNLSTQKTYSFSIDHPDSTLKIDLSYFINEILTKISGKKWVLNKKNSRHFLKITDLYDANLCGFFSSNEILDESEYKTVAHDLIVRNSNYKQISNKSIPILKHVELFEDLSDDVFKMVKKLSLDDSFFKFNSLILDTLGDIEKNGIFVDPFIFKKHFNTIPNDKNLVYSEYNPYTSTGRPSNRFGGVNYAAIKISDGSRNAFISRHGKDGRMILIDYTTFHPRIICNLANYKIPINVNIYEYLAKLYFKDVEIDENKISDAKTLTFRQFYGGLEEKYQHIKYLASLKKFIDIQWDFFQKNGYVLTPIFGRKITNKHILDPNPNKLFNYILQAVEGEISIPAINNVIEYLNDKITKPVLYTYDAVLYDFHKDDGLDTLKQIIDIMSLNREFPMKTYIGNSYGNMNLLPI